jgi:hypothetical protein
MIQNMENSQIINGKHHGRARMLGNGDYAYMTIFRNWLRSLRSQLIQQFFDDP